MELTHNTLWLQEPGFPGAPTRPYWWLSPSTREDLMNILAQPAIPASDEAQAGERIPDWRSHPHPQAVLALVPAD